MLVFFITRVLTKDVSGNQNRIRSCLRKDSQFFLMSFSMFPACPWEGIPLIHKPFPLKPTAKKVFALQFWLVLFSFP